MTFHKIRIPECHLAKGLVVVIDVIRAFTTAAFAFQAGVKEIWLTGGVEEAFELHRRFPETLLAGEVQGEPIPGFHFGNSPVEIAKAPIRGKTLIFRTSSGTQGVVKAKNASRILVSSFVVAEATLQRISALSPSQVTFIITGTQRGGFEDLALADYLEDKLSRPVDPAPYLERVRLSPSGALFSAGLPHFPPHDLEACCQIDTFDFALEVFREVFRENHLHILRPILK